MPGSKPLGAIKPRTGYGGAYGRSYGAVRVNGENRSPSVQNRSASVKPGSERPSAKSQASQSARTRAPSPSAKDNYGGGYGNYGGSYGGGGSAQRRDASRSRSSLYASADSHYNPAQHYEQWPSSASAQSRQTWSGGRAPREAWAEPEEPEEPEEPAPPEPNREAYEEAMDGIDQEIEALQAEFRDVQSVVLESKAFTKTKAEIRSQLDMAAARLSELQEQKEMLLRTGVTLEGRGQAPQEEDELAEEESRRLAELDSDIDALEEEMWSRRLTLAEEKRLLRRSEELNTEKLALKANERLREAKRARSQDKAFLLRQQVDEINEEIRAARSEKKAITQDYQKLLQWRQQEANNIGMCLRRQEAISRKLDQKQQERTRIDLEFVRQEQNYKAWLATRRPAKARAPTPARARSRPPPRPGSPTGPDNWAGGKGLGRRERPLSPRQRARPPRERDHYPAAAEEEQEHFGEVEQKEQELEGEKRDIQEQIWAEEVTLQRLDFAIKFCNDLLKRKPPKPQAPRHTEDSKKVDATFEKCVKVPPKDTRLQAGKDYLNEWHPSTTSKKAYQRARRTNQQQANARSRSVEARLKQPPDVQGRPFDQQWSAPGPQRDEKRENRVDQGYVKKTFGGMCLVRHSLSRTGLAGSALASWRVLEDLNLRIGTVEDVLPVVVEAESMRAEVQKRLQELEAQMKDVAKERVQLVREKKSRQQCALEEESLDRVSEATEDLARTQLEAMQQGLEAISRLVRAPWRDRRAREVNGRRPLLRDERMRRREDKEPTPLEVLKDVITGARSIGISDQRLADALDLVARVERQANEALLELAVEGLREAREVEDAANPRDRRLAAKADLRHAINQSEAAGVDEHILERAREVVSGKVAIGRRRAKSRRTEKLAKKAMEEAAEGEAAAEAAAEDAEEAVEQDVDAPSEGDASGQGFW